MSDRNINRLRLIARIVLASWFLGGVVLPYKASYAEEPAINQLSPEHLHRPEDDKTLSDRNRIAGAIAGHWAGVTKLQAVLDELSPNTDYVGQLDTFDAELVEAEEFWNYRQLREAGPTLKELAANRKHEIVATGNFAASGAREPFFGFFMLTQKHGETFLSVLNIDAKTFEPWPLQIIPAKDREQDLLFVGIGHARHRQWAVFQRATQDARREGDK